jgi:hypothetical protein
LHEWRNQGGANGDLSSDEQRKRRMRMACSTSLVNMIGLEYEFQSRAINLEKCRLPDCLRSSEVHLKSMCRSHISVWLLALQHSTSRAASWELAGGISCRSKCAAFNVRPCVARNPPCREKRQVLWL